MSARMEQVREALRAYAPDTPRTAAALAEVEEWEARLDACNEALRNAMVNRQAAVARAALAAAPSDLREEPA